MAIDGGRVQSRPGSNIVTASEATPHAWQLQQQHYQQLQQQHAGRILLWPLAADGLIAFSANGYVEHIALVGHDAHDITGRSSYPTQAVQLQQFADALDSGLLRGWVSDAKAAGQTVVLLLGETAPREPIWFYTCDGEQVAMPGMIYRVGRSAIGKVGPPTLAPAVPLFAIDGMPINLDDILPEVVPGGTWVISSEGPDSSFVIGTPIRLSIADFALGVTLDAYSSRNDVFWSDARHDSTEMIVANAIPSAQKRDVVRRTEDEREIDSGRGRQVRGPCEPRGGGVADPPKDTGGCGGSGKADAGRCGKGDGGGKNNRQRKKNKGGAASGVAPPEK